MIGPSQVQNLLAGWWFDYDQGNFDAWPTYFTSDAHFSCRSDSGTTGFEDFVRADVTGRDAVVAWQTGHRRQSPYPLRHNGTNVHLPSGPGEGPDVAFRSYIFVTQVVGGAVAPLASGTCTGAVREEGPAIRISDLQVVLDFSDSVVWTEVEHRSTF
ncbi:MAG: nuclear transport factor 2 family protein [Actinomycetota bacterium]|nr:nuclear transport factor 2 family protein [Actinomycetota bacterium]